MKRLDDLTNAELLSLSEDDVSILVKLECAHEGLALPAAPTPYEETAVPKNDFYYHLEGTGLKSRSESVLQEVLDVLLRQPCELVKVDYDYNIGYGFDWIKGADEHRYRIEKVQCYRYEDLTQRADFIARQKVLKERYEKDRKAYDAEVKAINQVRARVYDQLESARAYAATVGRMKARHQEYVDLAGGDAAQAKKFFLKAHGGIDNDILEDVLGKGWNVEAAEDSAEQAVH